MKPADDNAAVLPSRPSELERARHTLNNAMHVFLEVHAGGEGTEALRIVRNRDPGPLERVNSYWGYTLFSRTGRPFPLVPMVVYLIYVVGVCAFGEYYLGPEGILNQWKSLKPEPKDVVSIVGLAAFLVLTFRNNSAYQRWYEGATQYYTLCGQVGNAARMVAAVTPPEHGVSLLYWLVAILYTAKQQLTSSRVSADYTALQAVLPEEIWEELERQHDKFHWALFRYGQIAARIDLNGKTEAKAAENVMMAASNIHAAYMQCWKLLRTPMPFAYLTHLRVFLILWLMVMPWVFITYYTWYTIIVCAFICFGILGVEEAAVEVEQPFGRDANDLPLDHIAHDTFQQIFDFICHIGFDDLGRSLSHNRVEKSV